MKHLTTNINFSFLNLDLVHTVWERRPRRRPRRSRETTISYTQGWEGVCVFLRVCVCVCVCGRVKLETLRWKVKAPV